MISPFARSEETASFCNAKIYRNGNRIKVLKRNVMHIFMGEMKLHFKEVSIFVLN